MNVQKKPNLWTWIVQRIEIADGILANGILERHVVMPLSEAVVNRLERIIPSHHDATSSVRSARYPFFSR
jgi:hypothetical protein